MAQSERGDDAQRCPLSGVKRTLSPTQPSLDTAVTPIPLVIEVGVRQDRFRNLQKFCELSCARSKPPKDAEARKVGKERDLLTVPPPPATEATVVLLTDDQISAIETDLWSIMTYSFFPKIGTAFIRQRAMQPGTKSVMQIANSYLCALSIFLDQPQQ